MNRDSGSNAIIPSTLDYDLHGIVGIRVIDALPDDVAVVNRQIGPIQTQLYRTPDIVIKFVDELPSYSSVNLLGVDETGFTDDSFLVLRSKHKTKAKVQIALEQVGGRCEIICERGLPLIPLLIPIINLTALVKGSLPLHASAFIYEGTSVLTTGWSKGGKTETLLAFMAEGAQYIGDEWVYITASRDQICGIPEPIRLWDWHLKSLPQYKKALTSNQRIRLQAIRWFLLLDRASAKGRNNKMFPFNIIRRLNPILKRQLYVDILPQKLFGGDRISLSGPLDKIIFVGVHDSPDIRVKRIDSLEVARRMVFSLQYEQIPLLSHYFAFRFAFPEKTNRWIDQSQEIQYERLKSILGKRDVHAVLHPYPISIPRLYQAISPLLVQDTVLNVQQPHYVAQ